MTAGRVAAGCVFAVVLAPLAAVIWRAGGLSGFGAAEWAAIRFTVVQAAVSAVLSVAAAIPLARALARREFPGRGVLVTLLGAPFLLPVIVAILGLLAVFGQAGLLGRGLGLLGVEAPRIYGFHGVVLAHVFFNLPLAVRLLLQGWLAIPGERFRLAASLGFGPSDVMRHLEWPMLRDVVPGLLAVIFLICTTSFAVALTLGGGPAATTVELAIYQAFRFDFDPGKAALLSIGQLILTGLAALAAARIAIPANFGDGLDRTARRWDATALWLRAQDALLIGAGGLFLLLPLGAITAQGLAAFARLPDAVWAAAARSLVVALVSAGLAIGLALALAVAASRKSRSPGFELAGTVGVAVSPLVLGTGLYLLLLPVADPVALALPVTALANALMSLPFAFRALLPAARAAERDYGRLADSLGMGGWARLRRLTLPRLRRPLGFAAGLAAALSMGDLGVIALFADPEFATLPLQVYRLMAAYRMEEAAAAALLLLGLTLALFWAFDRGGRGHATV
ncbi:MAG: ABC transporter permease subunit [Paracoccaceae bacterium]|nr:ABC transporter permease subunit [Paracoccaceae bacterium]